MNKYDFSDAERFAIWKEHGAKCFWCGEPLRLFDTTIDHIIPESTLEKPGEVDRIRKEYSLDKEFEINNFYNWVPCHSRCNSTKGDDLFRNSPVLLSILHRVGKIGKKAKTTKENVENNKNVSYILGRLKIAINGGLITQDEINLLFGASGKQSNDEQPSEQRIQFPIAPGWIVIQSDGKASITPAIQFLDHIRVDKTWTAKAVLAKDQGAVTELSVEWHPSIQRAIGLIERMKSDPDEMYRRLFSGSEGKSVISDVINTAKSNFFGEYEKLHETLSNVMTNLALLDAALEGVPFDKRVEAINSYFTFASLKIVWRLQRLIGSLLDEEDRQIVRIFNDLPLLNSHLITCLPYRSTVGNIAFNERTFLRARVGSEDDTAYEVVMPSHLADAYAGYVIPDWIYYTWVLPQWIVRFGTLPPEQSSCRVFRATDEDRHLYVTRDHAASWVDVPQKDDMAFAEEAAQKIAIGVPPAVLKQSGPFTVVERIPTA